MTSTPDIRSDGPPSEGTLLDVSVLDPAALTVTQAAASRFTAAHGGTSTDAAACLVAYATWAAVNGRWQAVSDGFTVLSGAGYVLRLDPSATAIVSYKAHKADPPPGAVLRGEAASAGTPELWVTKHARAAAGRLGLDASHDAIRSAVTAAQTLRSPTVTAAGSLSVIDGSVSWLLSSDGTAVIGCAVYTPPVISSRSAPRR